MFLAKQRFNFWQPLANTLFFPLSSAFLEKRHFSVPSLIVKSRPSYFSLKLADSGFFVCFLLYFFHFQRKRYLCFYQGKAYPRNSYFRISIHVLILWTKVQWTCNSPHWFMCLFSWMNIGNGKQLSSHHLKQNEWHFYHPF